LHRAGAPLEGARAIGRLTVDGPWIGFGYRAGLPHLVVGAADGVQDAPADRDLLLALAIAHFAEAFAEAPPDIEATQSDLSALVRHLMGTEADAGRRALLGVAMDAIDDGLAGDAVAEKLAAARSPATASVDPVELLLVEARQLSERA
jgi:ketopantoate reductase